MSRVATRIFCLCLVISMGLSGCDTTPSDTPSPTETPDTATPQPTPTRDVGLTPTPGGAFLPPGPVTLTIWTTQEFAPTDEDAGGRLLLNQLLAFDRSHPDLTVEVIVKRPTGPGGIMDYLNTASEVAPSVLPDVTVLNSQMLRTAATFGVVQRLDDLLLPEMVEDLYPVAGQLGRVDGYLLGIPFAVDFEHVVYNTGVLTDTSPTTWEAIIDSDGPYLFPAADGAPVDSTLIHYMAAGGTLYDEEANPRFEIDPLTEVFRFYQRADSGGIIPVAALHTDSLDASWDAYQNGNALIAHTSATRYLSGRAGLLKTAVSPVPGPDKAARSLVSAWHLVIITPDPSRQQLAAELLDWLMAPDNLGVWSYAGRWLPAADGAMAAWPTNDDYVRFAREQILSAIPCPGEEYYQVAQSLGLAVRDVLLGRSSPAAAAANANP